MPKLEVKQINMYLQFYKLPVICLTARYLLEVCGKLVRCVVPKHVLNDLEDKQRIVASFVTGLSKSGGNSSLALESGLMPIEIRYHLGLHRFFNRLLDSSSTLIQEALAEHKSAKWGSSYKKLITNVIDRYQLRGLTKSAAKSQIMEQAWNCLLKDIYTLKSLKHYSVRQQQWELPEHINDTEHSTVLSKF